uniref:Uncharacterized protein LOC100178656 n=1 Tax=Phallusia mammillata TaxID=59560 RepID=A0A6F9DHJ0_9ASCI|nr:uncharacterized protein LOC100178656 [Phallusia mammillata]
MRQGVQEMSVETLEDSNDLVTVLQVLHRNIAETQRSFLQWRDEYKDLSTDPDFDNEPLLCDIKMAAAEAVGPENEKIKTVTMHDKAVSTDSLLFPGVADDSGHCDVTIDGTEVNYDDLLADCDVHEEEYFEVMSVASDEGQNDETSLDGLVQKLRKLKESLASKNSEVEREINGVKREASEGCSLRERIGMNHRSLTLLERRQEKVMREALYENVTANTRIRQLQDEVIQLRIRDTQHQSDIQRLMAENSRLKLKLMESRARSPAFSAQIKSKKPPSPVPTPPLQEEKRNMSPVSLPGLMELEDLNRPVCTRVVQRATMSTMDFIRPFELTDEITLHENTAQLKKTRCPLCHHMPGDETEFDPFMDDISDCLSPFATRSIGTSTCDLQNVVSVRTSVCFMGVYLPLPLFVAYFLQRIEETMNMVGQICFSEIAPFDPSFPEFQLDFADFMKSVHNRFCQYYRPKQD